MHSKTTPGTHFRFNKEASHNFYVIYWITCAVSNPSALRASKIYVSTHLIKPGHIPITSGSDPHYYPGQWVIRVSDADPVVTLFITCPRGRIHRQTHTYRRANKRFQETRRARLFKKCDKWLPTEIEHQFLKLILRQGN